MVRFVLERLGLGCLVGLLALSLQASAQSPATNQASSTDQGDKPADARAVTPLDPSVEQSADLLAEEQAAFAAAALAAEGTVVQIETFGGLERVGKELIADGPTTGTVVAKEGWIISSMFNFRQQPASILVSLADGTRAPARIVARDYSRELALLKVETELELKQPVPCPMDEVTVGQWAIGLGRTFDRESVSQSVGIISALDRAYGKAVQTDAKVSPVNYGGPLIDLQGRVIGVLAPISPGAILEGDSSQLYDSGIGFAVPLVDILERLPEMQAGHDIRSGKLGIVVANQNELAGPVKVAGAAPGSPAAKAGLKPGDTIIAAAGRKVELLAHLRHALGPRDAGSSFEFTVLRAGKKIDLQCTLVDEVPTYRLRYLGMEAENLEKGGVRITNVLPKTPAADAQLSVGMRIVGCGDVTVNTTSDLRQQVSIAELDTPLQLKVVSDADSAEPKEVAVKVTLWPTKLEGGPTSRREQAGDADRKIEDIELALGDFPNKAWAWCPELERAQPAPDKSDEGGEEDKGEDAADKFKVVEELGLLLLLPEPGDVDRNKLREMWAPLIREGWCVAMIQSGNKQRWSAEEIELIERVRSQVADKRPLDKGRTVIGGLGVGGRLALVGARTLQGKAAGVLLLGTPLENVKVQRENAPSESLHFLTVGPRENYGAFLEQLQKLGYPASEIPIPDLVPSKWDTVPIEPVTNWLLGLNRI